MSLNFDFFVKTLSIYAEMEEGGTPVRHHILFKNVASLFVAEKDGSRLEDVSHMDDGEICSFTYVSQGTGSRSHSFIEGYESNPHFLIEISEKVLAVEAERVSFDSTEFYAYKREE
ncbi:hypothetical protein P4T89_10035 [Bacillus nakamurai]|uniref:YxiG family protein n=1 Tax=Bacillus nakamurai TaxID=1793963 RepID=UPI0012E8A029|nr:hypothetical protein [Bacillus nakamurai]MCP6680746.1 hypothetical protein [Bacillus nakamurai]MED1227914.1 hypothetical protein [Bacillus nakamurai]